MLCEAPELAQLADYRFGVHLHQDLGAVGPCLLNLWIFEGKPLDRLVLVGGIGLAAELTVGKDLYSHVFLHLEDLENCLVLHLP